MAKDKYSLSRKRFGRLKVLKRIESLNGRMRYLCKCDCGTIKEVSRNSLLFGGTQSCGCLAKELLGDTRRTHGRAQTSEYNIWCTMKRRCMSTKNNSYERYGARGITICDDWLCFENFYRDMGPKPDGYSIERINNAGNYEPSNCRWATIKDQANNRRSNVLLEYDGITKNTKEWSVYLGISYTTLRKRLYKQGWSVEDALTKPTKGKGELNAKKREIETETNATSAESCSESA